MSGIPGLSVGTSRPGARLFGYRAAFLLLPGHGHASVALASRTGDLPAIASLLSSLQQPLTGNDLSREIDAFAT